MAILNLVLFGNDQGDGKMHGLGKYHQGKGKWQKDKRPGIGRGLFMALWYDI